MRRAFTVAHRVVKQLLRNRRFLALSTIGPLVIVYFLKLFFDTGPAAFDTARYAVPVAAFLVHFLALSLVPLVAIMLVLGVPVRPSLLSLPIPVLLAAMFAL